jgi:glycine dehydrogenase subunit 2
MKEFKQAKWPESTVFEIGSKGRRGYSLPQLGGELEATFTTKNFISECLRRKTKIKLPEVSEVEVVRHFTRLSQMNFGIDNGFYPLGSCTMKYNPKINDVVASSDKVHWIHPYQPEETMQGSLKIMYDLSLWLAELTGVSKVSLQPAAGAHGEFTGTLIMRAYHRQNGDLKHRDEIIIPDSAHGTNPASASMAGFKVIIVPTNQDGCIEIDTLKEAASSRTAGLMLTNPNTLGIFEKDILEIEKIIHEVGGVMYYDGANLNAVLGKTRPGDMGFDIVHINLHKTFSTPHGGGGPGAGPVGVKEYLEEFLPVPLVEFNGKHYYFNYDVPHTIGKVGAFYGNFEVLVRAYAYILSMGAEGLEKATEIAVLNANYLAHKLSKIRGFDIPYSQNKLRKHEFVLSCLRLKSETGVSAANVAKRLLDFGVHAPTIYFPSIVQEALMIEPTETETIEDLDRFVEILSLISEEAYTNPEIVLGAPHNTTIGPVDQVKASHPKTICPSWKIYKNIMRLRTYGHTNVTKKE